MIDNSEMDLRQLEYFIAVAELRSFTRAAEALHVVQSTVSAGVKALEHDLGTTLVVRSTRQFHLTAAGEELVRRGQDLLTAARATRDAVKSAEGRVTGRLRVGAPASELPFNMPEVIGAFRQRYPAVDLQLLTSPEGSIGLQQDVVNNRLDASFCSGDIFFTELQQMELACSPVVLAVAEHHPLAKKRQVTLAEIAGESFIDFPEGFGQRSVTDAMFRDAGLMRSISTETTTTALVTAFVRENIGIALLPESATVGQPGITTLQFPAPVPQWRISLIHHEHRWHTPALDALLALVTERITGGTE